MFFLGFSRVYVGLVYRDGYLLIFVENRIKVRGRVYFLKFFTGFVFRFRFFVVFDVSMEGVWFLMEELG